MYMYVYFRNAIRTSFRTAMCKAICDAEQMLRARKQLAYHLIGSSPPVSMDNGSVKTS